MTSRNPFWCNRTCLLLRQFDGCHILYTICSFSERGARERRNFAFSRCVSSLLREGQLEFPIYVGFEHTWRYQVPVAEDTLVSSAGFNELKESANTRVSM